MSAVVIDTYDFISDFKTADTAENKARAIEKYVQLNNEKINNERLTKTDIKELEWKIEGLRKDTTSQIELLRKDTLIEIEKIHSQTELLRKDTTSQMELLRKDTTSQTELLRKDTTSQIELFRKDTTIELEKLKSTLTGVIIKTVVWTGAGIILALTGVLLTMFRYFKPL